MTYIKHWEIEEVKACLVTNNAREAMEQSHRSLPSVYTLRTQYRKFLLNDPNIYIPPALIGLFNQLKTEGVAVKDWNFGKQYTRTPQVDPVTGEPIKRRDPEVEMEILTKNFVKEMIALSHRIVRDRMALEVKGVMDKLQRKFDTEL